MQSAPTMASATSRSGADAGARCPHLIFGNVLGADAVAELLRHVARREADFKPAVIRNRRSGERRIDPRQRDCLYLDDLGSFKPTIDSFIRGSIPKMLAELQLGEAALEPREFEICAYGEGGHFGAHVDTNELTDRVRVISCVYYFAASPQRFSGGALRLHGFPVRSADGATVAPAFVDVAPQTDTLVAFPSWMRHEVLPVRVPSGAWADRRFSINCWVLRPKRNAGDAQRGT